MSKHEYVVIGHPREKIIFWITFIAILSGPPAGILLSKALTLIPWKLSVSLSPAILFAIMFFVFNRWLWKTNVFSSIFHFPNLNGTWECQGKTLELDKSVRNQWAGMVKIEQNWDKVIVTLSTSSSSSRSVSIVGGITYTPTVGYKFSYSYHNDPSITAAPDMQKHEGFCELLFKEDLSSAEGSYFNGNGRNTFGQMILTRKNP